MNSEYNSTDIIVLTDREHVRKRTNIYLGSTELSSSVIPSFNGNKFSLESVSFVKAAFKAVSEIIENSVDELTQISQTEKVITITTQPEHGRFTVFDNGRGVPIDIHETGKYTPEVVFGSLRSGRNFSDERTAGVIGVNGVGSSCTNFTSSNFFVDIWRDGKHYHQEFNNGGEIVSAPIIKKIKTKQTGTMVSFQLDSEVFKDINIPMILIRNKAIEIAFNNPELKVVFNDEEFHFKKGIEDLIKPLDVQYFKFEYSGMEFFILFDVISSIDEQIFTWVNSSLLYDGGTCNSQFLNSFTDSVIEFTRKDAKRLGAEVTKNDIRQDLLILGTLKLTNPSYDSQSKSRLTGPSLRKEFDEMISKDWSLFVRRNKEWINKVIERAAERHHKNANSKAIKDHQKVLKRRIPGLLDAVGDDRTKCKLFLLEGLSAASSLVEVRDPETMGSYPLGGKINNVYGSTVAQVLKMNKITDILAVLGLTPGIKADREQMKFGQVIIATDADPDGSDILTTLVCLFFNFWPELFDPKNKPVFYRLNAPNVIVTKGKKREHFATRTLYEQQREKFKGWTISYAKGLGSLEQEDWIKMINNDSNYFPIVADSSMGQVMSLLFSEDASARRNWLTNIKPKE